jgi:hypothetical protein
MKDTQLISTINFIDSLFNGYGDKVVIGSYPDHKKQGDPWLMQWWDENHPPALANSNYVCVSTFRPGEDDKPCRRGEYFHALHLIVLDDIGTKYDPPNGWGEPTYVMQTSIQDGKVNTQWGYMLAGPIDDPDLAKWAAKAIVGASGSSDNIGDLSRLVRIPGHNLKPKYEGEQLVRITEWHPDNTYTLDEMLGWCNLTRESQPAQQMAIKSVELERALAHPAAQAFEQADLLKDGELAGGTEMLAIECPFADAHTTNAGGQTGLSIRPDGTWFIKCFHESCKGDKDQFDLEQVEAHLVELGAEPIDPRAVTQWVFDQVKVEQENKDQWSDPSKRYVFIPVENQWWDLRYRQLLTPGALNTLWKRQFPGKKEAPHLSTVLALRPDWSVAQGIGYLPIDSPYFEFDGGRYVNLYRPPTLVPIEGDVSNWLRLISHIYGQYADLVLDHMAFTVQHPEKKIRWQVLCTGAPRTGKTMSMEHFRYIFGPGCKMVDPSESQGAFDDHYVGSKVLVFEEVWGERPFYNRIKPKLANDHEELLNVKSQGKVLQANRYSIYMFSNFPDALALDPTGDKLLVIKGPDDPLEPEFYETLGKAFEDSDMGARVYHHLLNRDLTDFSYGRLPVRTEAAMDMSHVSAPEAEQWLVEAITSGTGPFEPGRPPEHFKPGYEHFAMACCTWADVRQALMEVRLWRKTVAVEQVLSDHGFEKVRGEVHGAKTPTVYVSKEAGLGSMTFSEKMEWLIKWYWLSGRELTKPMSRYARKIGLTPEIVNGELLVKDHVDLNKI